MKKQHWLFKTEPSTYSIEDLARDKKTPWNGIRNHQAKTFLKNAKRGDIALIYHSGTDKAVVGLAEVTREAFPDPDPKKPGDWVQVEIKFLEHFKTPVTLGTLKTAQKRDARLKNLRLIKQSRLSAMPITNEEFESIDELRTLS